MRALFVAAALLLTSEAATAAAQVPTTLNLENSPTLPPSVSFKNTNPAAPSLSQMGRLDVYSSYPHSFQAGIEVGSAGGHTGDFGGFFAFHTKADDGLGSVGEALVLTPGHQLYMPFGQYYARFNTPGDCAAGMSCGTTTWTFATRYATTAGVPQQPNCPSLLIQDESVPGQIWVGSISAISSTSVTYSYASLVAVPTPHTIDVYAVCYALAF